MKNRKTLISYVSLFLMALLPRVPGLGVFLTPDEHLWIGRSGRFLAAILRGDWAATFEVGHPGVTTRWTGVMGILAQSLFSSLPLTQEYLSNLREHPLDVLAAVRLPTVIIVSLAVVLVYWLLKRLVGHRAAFLAAFLLAFDPFYIALSRVIHHDALASTFLLLSLLGFLVYLECQAPSLERQSAESRSTSFVTWGLLLFSGTMAGLAFLSKSPSVVLAPFLALVDFAYRFRERRWGGVKPVVRDLLVWGGVAVLVFFALWPSMWVNPVGTVKGVMDKALGYAGAPHERGNFFLGRPTPDPGPLFYPVAFLFRTTPVTLFGLALLVWGMLTRNSPSAIRKRWLYVLGGFAVFYLIFMTSGAKKFDRYILPSLLIADVMAGVALGKVLWLQKRYHGASFAVRNSLVALLALSQVALALPHYPYYLTYYNPLLGGIKTASKVMFVGWGEGYDQVARYLNSKDNAKELKVATWYSDSCLAPFFQGKVYKISVRSQKAVGVVPWYETDYVVFYINQVQREIPTRGTVEFFKGLKPEYTVKLAGLEYAWVYKVPDQVPLEAYPYEHVAMVDFGDAIRLLGYDVSRWPFRWEGRDYLDVTLYWQSLKPVDADYQVYMRLVDEDGHTWSQHNYKPVFDSFFTSRWEVGTIIRDRRGVEIPPGLPAGLYRVGVRLFDPVKNKAAEPPGGEFWLEPIRLPLQKADGG